MARATSMLDKVHREIEKYKDKLYEQPVCENFGRNEIRALNEKYDYHTLQDISVLERNQIFDAIKYFSDWCATYTEPEHELDR